MTHWEEIQLNKTDQISCTQFLKYMLVSLFMISIWRRDIQLATKIFSLKYIYKYALIGYSYHTYVTSTDHEYFFIHDDLFDQILPTDQDNNIELNMIPKYVVLPSINYSSTDPSTKLKKRSVIFSPRHIIKRIQ